MKKLLTGRRINIVSALMLAGLGVTLPGRAEVGLRVESHPIDAPIDAYVRVTEGGASVTGLTPADFAVTLDGSPVDQLTLTLPPSQDSTQKQSIVIVVAGSPRGPRADFSDLIGQLAIGDMVSVVKYWGEFDFPDGPFGRMIVLPFTEIDNGAASERINRFIRTRHPSKGARYYGLFDGLMAATSQFATASATLPAGPKAIVTLACCGGIRFSLSDVIARANARGIPIFNGLYSQWAAEQRTLFASFIALATKTGGIPVTPPNGPSNEDALAPIASWLRDGYRISIPHDAVSDCDRHKLAVTVGGEATSVAFSRCDSTPDHFRFEERLDAPVAEQVTSNAVTITGIDSAALVRVYGGEYSIGCNTTFTRERGRILPGESVCVRHTTAASGGLDVSTLLIIGGVSNYFRSSTVFP